jgi:hypothetical protein
MMESHVGGTGYNEKKKCKEENIRFHDIGENLMAA